jgi:hypothetical protein
VRRSNLRTVRRAHTSFASASLWLAALLTFCSEAVSAETVAEGPRSDALVARRMGAFYEVFVGRELTQDEIRNVAEEFVQSHSRSGMSIEAIRQLAREFGVSIILLREDRDGPAAHTVRDRVLGRNYFSPGMKGTLELRLMTEPDPVRVVDTRAKRLMTERDVISLANIRAFATSEGAPVHRELSRRQIEDLVTLLNGSLGSRGSTMPQFFEDASSFWAGVRQQWPYFTAQQRSQARAYARRTWRVSMPVEMYASLWGLDRADAMSRWTSDVSARIRGRADFFGGLDNLNAAIDAMFGGPD